MCQLQRLCGSAPQSFLRRFAAISSGVVGVASAKTGCFEIVSDCAQEMGRHHSYMKCEENRSTHISKQAIPGATALEMPNAHSNDDVAGQANTRAGSAFQSVYRPDWG